MHDATRPLITVSAHPFATVLQFRIVDGTGSCWCKCGLRKHLIMLSRGQGRETDANETKPQWSQTIPRIAVPSLVGGGRGRSSIVGAFPEHFRGRRRGFEVLHFNRPHIVSRPTPVPGLTLASLRAFLYFYSLNNSSDFSLFRHWLVLCCACAFSLGKSKGPFP